MKDTDYDLVYIVKPSEFNPELRYSLRSVAKYCSFRKIFIVGYKPSWVTNCEYVPTDQSLTKWKNSTLNVTTACKCADISDDFILMNDDFFATKPISRWKHALNVRIGTVGRKVIAYEKEGLSGEWRSGYAAMKRLLIDLRLPTDFDFEIHLPMIINKQKFLHLLEDPEVVEFLNTDKVLLKRTLYGNYYLDTEHLPRSMHDVKLKMGEDLTKARLRVSWISVYDGVVPYPDQYPKLNEWLTTEFPNKCIYEK